MVEFGGWDMPIQYASVLDEHRACRERGVVFDVSHLGTVRVAGAAAFATLQSTLTNDLGRIGVGRAQYTHLLDPDDAHVEDDIIVWWVGDDEFFVMPNASNTDRVVAAFAHPELEAHDVTETRAVLAVQGPNARALAEPVLGDAARVPRFAVAHSEFAGTPIIVAGTGYTGEDGFEVHVPRAAAAALWDGFVAAELIPAGLGARDTLRLEAGLPLHGHELGPGITPLQASLGWVVRWDKGEFRGRAPLAAERERGVPRRLRGLAIEGRQPARAGVDVLDGDTVVGEVTSGNFSPVLGHAIALAFVPPDTEIGSALTVDVRGRRLTATVCALPFVSR